MKTIAFIPIDNRSVCYELPKQIVKLDSQYKLLLPDRDLLGDLTKNADIDSIFNWLKNLNNIDIVIISLDTIAYGGLISSRRSNDSFEKIKQRIDNLSSILKKLNAKVYAFSSIMRISNNNINEEEKEYWNLYGTKIFEYSYNLHKSEVENKTFNSEYNIPEYILNDYLRTRERNFKINKYYIELKKEGLFDTLVFSKDDCAKYGFNVKEAELLQTYTKEEKNIFIKTGADEIPLTLLSRAINSEKHIKIAPVYTIFQSINKISKYEDIPVKTSVESQIELAGGVISSVDKCDMVLIVNNFEKEQGELVMDINVPLFSGEFSLPDKPFFIADILNANGSDNNFVNFFLTKNNLKNFYGYAGWNTTGNTLGSSLSSALTYFNAKIPDKSEFIKLQIIRFLDDWAYQANIRKEIRDDTKNLTNNVIKEKMKQYEKILCEKFSMENLKFKYSFPWNRFFEIEITVI